MSTPTEEPSNSFLDDDPFMSGILSSQNDIDEQILQLKETLGSELCMEEKLNELQNFLSSSSLKNVEIDVLDEKILSVILSGAQKLYFEVIKSLDDKVKSKKTNENDIKNQLDLVIKLFKYWDSCIEHVKTLEKISINAVKSLPSRLFDVTVDALKHCKTSSENYGDYFKAVSDSITTVFKKCVATLNTFYKLLETVISFDTSQEDDMKILLKIIDETGKIATLSSGMDAKTLTDMWRQFGKLSATYCSAMKELSPITVTFHLKGLSESILNILTTICQKNDKKVNERSILCSRFLLKILEKLTCVYCGWIRSEIMIEIIVVLTNSFRYTEQCLKMNNYSADFVKFVITNFTSMIDPFVIVVFKNDSFRIAFFEYEKNTNKDYLGYHLLTLTIMKKLSTLPYETQQEWCKQENSILDICFQNVDKLTKEICKGQLEVQMSRDFAQTSYLADLYEATCVSIFTLVCQISEADFDALITLLIKHLLSGKYYAALLISDLWCFLCRLCSSEICYTSFKHLWQIHELLEHRESHMNVIVLSNLLKRQYNFLTEDDKNNFANGITSTMKPHQWRLIARMFDTQKKKQLQQRIDAAAVNDRLSIDLKNLEEQPSLRNMKVLIGDLTIMQAFNVTQDEKSMDTFTRMWNKIVHLMGDCEGATLRVLESLAIAVLRATNPPHGNSKYMTTILESMASLYPYASSELHLEFFRFFNRCATLMTENNTSIMTDLYIRLLGDSNLCVRQEAFESFESFMQACTNENFLASIATAIRNTQSEVSKTLPDYLSAKVSLKIVGFANEMEFFDALSVVDDKHVCRQRNSVERDEKVFKLDDTRDDEDVNKRAEKVCSDIEKLNLIKAQIKKDTCDRLRQACQRFLS